MKAKAVIFDFNGTLFMDSKYHDIAWGKTVLELTGIDIQNTPANKMFGHMNKDVIENLRPDFTLEQNMVASKNKESIYRELVVQSDEQLAPNVVELFDYLKDNSIPFTIASASIKDNIDFFIERFNLDRWIDKDLILYDDGRFDTKIPMYLEAYKLLNVSPNECVIFEDSKAGITSAKKSGVAKIVAICDESLHSVSKEYGADVCVTKYDVKDFDSYINI